MYKASIYWTSNSSNLTGLIDELESDPTVQFIPADQQDGDGEQVLTSDIAHLRELAAKFNCTVA